MAQSLDRRAFLAVAAGAPFVALEAQAQAPVGAPPPGFSGADIRVNGTTLHCVKGGRGPAVILLHGFPQDWVEFHAVMPRLARQFTVVAVDLPGLGKSAPAAGGYDKANLAGHVQALAQALKLERPYVVGHDLGGHVAYAYVRRFPDALRGAMILDVPVPGLAGWDEANKGLWHVGFMQAPGDLAEKLTAGRQAAFLGWFLDLGKFTPQERAYFIRAYGAPQLHAAFEIYRAFPKDADWNAAQMAANATPLVVAVGEKSFLNGLLPTMVEGYRARGMSRVDAEHIAGANHYVVTDNPKAVAELIARHAAPRAGGG